MLHFGLSRVAQTDSGVTVGQRPVIAQVEADPRADCSKLVVLTFGHKYYFDCSVLKPAGHYHPDVTYGRCVDKYTTEELRLGWGDWEPAKRDYYRCALRRVGSCRQSLAYVCVYRYVS